MASLTTHIFASTRKISLYENDNYFEIVLDIRTKQNPSYHDSEKKEIVSQTRFPKKFRRECSENGKVIECCGRGNTIRQDGFPAIGGKINCCEIIFSLTFQKLIYRQSLECSKFMYNINVAVINDIVIRTT